MNGLPNVRCNLLISVDLLLHFLLFSIDLSIPVMIPHCFNHSFFYDCLAIWYVKTFV